MRHIEDYMRHTIPVPSAGTVNPVIRLICGVVLQAVDDLCSPDEIRALDALYFWVDDGNLALLSAVGYELEPEQALIKALMGGGYAKQKDQTKLTRCPA